MSDNLDLAPPSEAIGARSYLAAMMVVGKVDAAVRAHRTVIDVSRLLAPLGEAEMSSVVRQLHNRTVTVGRLGLFGRRTRHFALRWIEGEPKFAIVPA